MHCNRSGGAVFAPWCSRPCGVMSPARQAIISSTNSAIDSELRSVRARMAAVLRQTHFALGNLMPRVQRVFLVTADCFDREFLAREQPMLPVIALAFLPMTATTTRFRGLLLSYCRASNRRP